MKNFKGGPGGARGAVELWCNERGEREGGGETRGGDGRISGTTFESLRKSDRVNPGK